jgi:hypothetical protein
LEDKIIASCCYAILLVCGIFPLYFNNILH